MKKDIVLLLALSLVLTGTSCQKEQALESAEGRKETNVQFTFCVEATKGVSSKALNLEDNTATGGNETLRAYWKTDEKVAVYFAGNYLGDLTATVIGSDKHKATLAGTLNTVSGLQAGSSLELLFPRSEWDYSIQNGAAPSETGALASQFDYALASVTVASVDEENKTIVPATGASFESQQSIFRFSFEADELPFAVKNLTIFAYKKMVQKREYENGEWKSVYGSVNIQPEAATENPLFVALRSEYGSATTYEFMAVGGENNALYVGTKAMPLDVLSNGVFASTTVSLSKYSLKESGTANGVL